jgi:hypothetical protein
MISARHTLTLAPAAAPQSQSPVVPRQVFAAGRQSFEALVRGTDDADEALACLFTWLPLREHGWDRVDTKIKRLHRERDGAVFRVERNQ